MSDSTLNRFAYLQGTPSLDSRSRRLRSKIADKRSRVVVVVLGKGAPAVGGPSVVGVAMDDDPPSASKNVGRPRRKPALTRDSWSALRDIISKAPSEFMESVDLETVQETMKEYAVGLTTLHAADGQRR